VTAKTTTQGAEQSAPSPHVAYKDELLAPLASFLHFAGEGGGKGYRWFIPDPARYEYLPLPDGDRPAGYYRLPRAPSPRRKTKGKKLATPDGRPLFVAGNAMIPCVTPTGCLITYMNLEAHPNGTIFIAHHTWGTSLEPIIRELRSDDCYIHSETELRRLVHSFKRI
jgi:hypothetical protein